MKPWERFSQPQNDQPPQASGKPWEKFGRGQGNQGAIPIGQPPAASAPPAAQQAPRSTPVSDDPNAGIVGFGRQVYETLKGAMQPAVSAVETVGDAGKFMGSFAAGAVTRPADSATVGITGFQEGAGASAEAVGRKFRLDSSSRETGLEGYAESGIRRFLPDESLDSVIQKFTAPDGTFDRAAASQYLPGGLVQAVGAIAGRRQHVDSGRHLQPNALEMAGQSAKYAAAERVEHLDREFLESPTGVGMRALGQSATMASGPVVGPAMAATQMADAQYQDYARSMEEQGLPINPEDAQTAMAWGAAMAPLEYIPFARIVRRAKRLTGGAGSEAAEELAKKLETFNERAQQYGKDVAMGGLEEGVTEFIQGVGQNVVAKDLMSYDEAREYLGEDLDEQTYAGMTVGAFLSAVLGLPGLARGSRTGAPTEADTDVPTMDEQMGALYDTGSAAGKPWEQYQQQDEEQVAPEIEQDDAAAAGAQAPGYRSVTEIMRDQGIPQREVEPRQPENTVQRVIRETRARKEREAGDKEVAAKRQEQMAPYAEVLKSLEREYAPTDPEKVDQSRDDLLTAIAKLGGIDPGNHGGELDVKTLRTMSRVGKPVVRGEGKGRTLDDLAETLDQYGYKGPNGQPLDPNSLTELIDWATRGRPSYSMASTREGMIDPDGELANWFGGNRTAVLKVLQKHIDGKPLTPKQQKLVDDVTDIMRGRDGSIFREREIESGQQMDIMRGEIPAWFGELRELDPEGADGTMTGAAAMSVIRGYAEDIMDQSDMAEHAEAMMDWDLNNYDDAGTQAAGMDAALVDMAVRAARSGATDEQIATALSSGDPSAVAGALMAITNTGDGNVENTESLAAVDWRYERESGAAPAGADDGAAPPVEAYADDAGYERGRTQSLEGPGGPSGRDAPAVGRPDTESGQERAGEDSGRNRDAQPEAPEGGAEGVTPREVDRERRAGDRRASGADILQKYLDGEKLSYDELLLLATYSEVAPLPNKSAFKRAWNEHKARAEADPDYQMPLVVSIDGDSLKWVNDNLSHDAGDAMLWNIGDALSAVGADAFHLSGDEFALLVPSREAGDDAVARAQQILAKREYNATGMDGRQYTIKGFTLTHGIGDTIKTADAEMQSVKERKEAAGERASRGVQPPWIHAADEQSGEGSTGADGKIQGRDEEVPAGAEGKGEDRQAGSQGTEGGRERLGPQNQKQNETPADAGVSVSEAANEAATSPQNDLPAPTEAQIEAGNYKKGHITLHGLDISIENPQGSTRSGTDPDGNAWEQELAHHYGYLKRTEGADGEHVDVFIGPNPESEKVFIVDQVNADGSFDEHKVLLGFNSKAEAKAGYSANYARGWKVGPISGLALDDFKQWLSQGDLKRPYASSEEAVSEKAGAEPAAPAAKIDDFGEKLEGARKDIVGQLNDAKRLKTSAVPLADSWPEPNYQKMLDDGFDPWAVAAVRAIRDEVPPKPRLAGRLARWANQVEALRDVATNILESASSREVLKQGLQEIRSLEPIQGRIDLYVEFGHEQSFKGLTFSKQHWTLRNGERDVTLWSIEQKPGAKSFGNMPYEIAVGKTKEEAIEKFREVLASGKLSPGRKSKATRFDIYRIHGEPDWKIGKKIGRDYVALKSFASVPEARDYLANNRDELESLLAKIKEIPAHRRQSNAPRVGADHRNGQDVTPEMFQDAFGFRGVQFGNWVEQGKRQQDLNDAYDALMDMAGILNVPSRALSLNGELGLAFGARGKGKQGKVTPKAHYESDHIVINLTKKEGAGSLAHEWWHALDNYFTRERGADSDRSFATEGASHVSVRADVKAAFTGLRQAINRTRIKQRSQMLDKTQTRDYWSTGREMSARAFESYVIERLRDQGASNDYLANIVSKEYWDAAAALGLEKDGTYPYPEAAEIPIIREAFDSFFRVLETRDTDSGVAFFSMSPAAGGRTPWAPGFPRAVVVNSPGEFQSHPDYQAAKDGDIAAAVRLAKGSLKLSDMAKIKRLADGVEGTPILVPVHAEEAVSVNRIPLAASAFLGKELGWDVDAGIVQAEKIGRGAGDGFYRIANQPRFVGEVKPGRTYVLLDDTVTQGGTFAALKGYIEANGGTVVGAVAMEGKQYSSQLSPTSDTLDALRKRWPDLEGWWNEQFGYDFDQLTESEARYLARVRVSSLDALRDRILAARQAGVSGRSSSSSGRDGPLTSITQSPEARPSAGLSASDVRKSIRTALGDKLAASVDVVQSVDDLPAAGVQPLASVAEPAYRDAEIYAADVQRAFISVLPEDADSDEVMAALDQFPAPLRRVLRALAKNDWLGFDYPALALSAAFSEDAAAFEMSPGLKSAIGALVNAGVGRYSTRAARIEGMYDPTTGKIYLVADGLHSLDRAAWVAWHELWHRGAGSVLGARLKNVLQRADMNSVVSSLADAIAGDRNMPAGQRLIALEEALAELNAADETGQYDHIERRYGVRVPRGMRAGIRGHIARFMDRIRAIFRSLGIGRGVVLDREVFEIITGVRRGYERGEARVQREEGSGYQIADDWPRQGDLFDQAPQPVKEVFEPTIESFLEPTGSITTQIMALRSPEAAATFLRPYTDYAQEVMLVVPVDEDYMPMGIIRHTKGTIDGAAVYPEVLAGELILSGAKGYWVAHNHPSGMSMPSDADRTITGRINDFVQPLGISMFGHVVLGEDGFHFLDHEGKGSDKARSYGNSVAEGQPIKVLERIIRRNRRGTDVDAITSPDQAVSLIERLGLRNKYGVLVLNNKHQLMRVSILDGSDAAVMRDESGYASEAVREFLRDVVSGNPAAAIVFAPEKKAAQNISNLLGSVVPRVLDAVVDQKSMAQTNFSFGLGDVGEFYSLAPEQTQTTEFRSWFGDSKVVDDEGNPVIAYRGEHGDHDGQFHSRLGALSFGSLDVANIYATRPNNTADIPVRPRVSPVYIKIEKPVINRPNDPFISIGDIRDTLGEEAAIEIVNKFSMDLEGTDYFNDWVRSEFHVDTVDDLLADHPDEVFNLEMYSYRLFDEPDVVRMFIDAGYDGAITAGTGESSGEIEYRVFEEKNVKSAIGNAGSFDPLSADIRFSLAPQDPAELQQTEAADRQSKFLKGILTQPIDRMFRLPFDVAGMIDSHGRLKAGVTLTEAAKKSIIEWRPHPEGRFAWMDHFIEKARAGLVDRYGLSDEYKARWREAESEERTRLLQGMEILQTLQGANVGAAEARVLQAVLTGEEIAEGDWSKLAEPVRRAIDTMGQELVTIGLLTPEAYLRNRGTYLHRSYLNHEARMTGLASWANQVLTKRRRRITGDSLKGRGIDARVSMDELRDSSAADWWGARMERGQADMALKDAQFILFEKLAPAGDGTETLEGMEAGGPRRTRVVERTYWPADIPVPAKFDAWENRGTWQVRAIKGSDVILWRDYTKAERERMGEIVDARYNIAKTFEQLSHDIAMGSFFADIAKNPEWFSANEPDGGVVIDAATASRWESTFVGIDWVKVPEGRIPKSTASKWGALAGGYVRAEIWRDLNELDKMQMRGTWATIMRQWKLNKTARNPVVHMNNIMSNLLFMDMADVRMVDLVRGIKSLRSRDGDYEEASRLGAFEASFVNQDLREQVLEPILNELLKEQSGGGGVIGTATSVGKMLDMLHRLLKQADSKMMNAYQLEDEIFRMATYLRRREMGDSPQAAAAMAREQFLDYDIRAPWVNAARRTVLPFISYTYRAVPVIARSISERPWKLAKYYTLAQAFTVMAYAMAPGDEDEEQRTMRDEVQGYTWLGIPRMVRMPWRDENDNPVFLDIRRWIPAGDVFDTNQGTMGELGIPAPIQASGPLMLAAELALNKQAFTGQPIYDEVTDTPMERAANVGSWAWKSWMPSAAWVPGSWYWEKLWKAGEGARDFMDRPYSLPQAVLSSAGVKLQPHDVEAGKAFYSFEFSEARNRLNQQARALARDLHRGLITQGKYDRDIAVIEKKMRLVEEKARRILHGK